MNALKHFKIYYFASLLLLSNLSYAQITNDISHEEALKAVLAAKEKAVESEVLVNIAVVDAGANLKAFIRMDESFLGSIDVAIKRQKRQDTLILILEN